MKNTWTKKRNPSDKISQCNYSTKETKKASKEQIEYAKIISTTLNVKLPKNNTPKDYWFFINKYKKEYDLKRKELLRKDIDITEYYKNSCFYETENLNKNTFEKIAKLIDIPGIYFLWCKKELVYIGKSMNLSERILSSIQERQRYKVITHISYYKTKNKADAHILEPMLITKYKPTLNSEFMCDSLPTIYMDIVDPYKLKKLVAFERRK